MADDLHDEIAKWVAAVFGVDPRKLTGSEHPKSNVSASAAHSAKAANPGPSGSTKASSAKLGERRETAQGAGLDKAIKDLRDVAADLVAAADGEQKQDLTKDLAKLDALIASAATEGADPAKQAAARDAADKAVQSLIDAAGAASKGGKAKVQAAYKTAMADKYGITFGGKDGKAVNDNMHYDKAYKVFEMVPLDHAVNDRMKDISLNTKLVSGDHAIGLFTGVGMQLGDFDENRTANYVDPNTGAVEKANSYNITVLHELGHSVDAQHGIMNQYGPQKGAGGWQQVAASTLAAQVAAGLSAHEMKGVLEPDMVLAGVQTLFTTHKLGDPPEGVASEGWKALHAALKDWNTLLAASYPYTVDHDFAGRGYIPHGNGTWMSYLSSDRKATFVTNYQWSAPGEWFAELYAICWYKGVAGPGAVHEKIRAFLPQGGGKASAGAPG